MTKDELLSNLQELLQIDDGGGALSYESVLEELPEWDSLAKLSFLAWLDREFKISISVSEVEKFKTIGDIAKVCGV